MTSLRGLASLDRSGLIRLALPVVCAVIGFVGTYAFVSAGATTYSHQVTLAATSDGVLGPNLQREQAAAFLDVDSGRPESVVDVRVESRVGSLLDIIVTADTQDVATRFAEELADQATAERLEASNQPLVDVMEVQRASIDRVGDEIAELEAQIAAAQAADPVDTRAVEALERQLEAKAAVQTAALTDLDLNQGRLDAKSSPLRVATSETLDSSRANLGRDAALGALVAAMLAVLTLAMLRADD